MINLFGKKKSDEDGGDESGEQAAKQAAADNGFKRDLRKARKFFEYAHSVADPDYAIECFINGLRHDPGNMNKHEELYELAKKRKVKGGKPAGWGDKPPVRGKEPVDRMLEAEYKWSKDPLSVPLMLNVMRRAVEADKVEGEEENLAEVAAWVGGYVLEFNASGRKPSKTIFLEARDLFSEIGDYSHAIEACKYAIRMDEDDGQLLQDLKNLEAEQTMQDGGLIDAARDRSGDSFTRVVRDIDKQRQLADEESLSSGDAAQQRVIDRARQAYEEAPDDLVAAQKLVDALKRTEKDQHEKEALTLLKDAWEKSGQYKFKVQYGDLIIKQYRRLIRNKSRDYKESPNPMLKEELDQLRTKLAKFELAEYTDRVKNYPTDLKLKHALGVRMYPFGKYDEAIGLFQEAQNDPKVRAQALLWLGKCYYKLEYLDEAIDTLDKGIENHPLDDDATGKELRYESMNALEAAAKKKKSKALAERARETASDIFQADINFRDIRERLGNIRQLVDELSD